MTLSVLMCTIPERNATELRAYFDDSRIEFLYLGDNQRLSLGRKRQLLLEMASGDYVVFVDDDDRVEPSYITELLNGIKSGADVVNFHVEYSLNGGDHKLVKYSKEYVDKTLPNHFERRPNHIMCIKRALALRVGYRDMKYAEDADFGARLKPFIKTEHNINKVLYYYDDNQLTSASRRYINRG